MTNTGNRVKYGKVENVVALKSKNVMDGATTPEELEEVIALVKDAQEAYSFYTQEQIDEIFRPGFFGRQR